MITSVSRPNGFPLENKEYEVKIQEYYDKIPDRKYQGHTAQINDVLTALANKTACDSADSKKTLELITAIYKSRSSKEMLQLPIDKNDVFYTIDGILKNVPYFYEKKAAVKNFTDGEITVGSNYKKEG